MAKTGVGFGSGWEEKAKRSLETGEELEMGTGTDGPGSCGASLETIQPPWVFLCPGDGLGSGAGLGDLGFGRGWRFCCTWIYFFLPPAQWCLGRGKEDRT